MFELKKWDPFTELSTIQHSMDELFRSAFSTFTPGLFRGEWKPSMEEFIRGDELVIRTDLPGIEPRDVDISVVGNMLTIKGERKSVCESKEGEQICRETSYGTFERTLRLHEGVDTDKVHASFKNGVLEVTMPLEKGALPRKIEVEIEGEHKGRKAA